VHPAPGERLLELRLVVLVVGERVLDALRERVDDRPLDRLVAVLEEERGERRLEQRREDVAVRREALELLVRDLVGAGVEQPVAELELARDDGAACPRDDVGADLREPALREVRVALVERARRGQLEDAVAEELEPLVRGRPVGRPGGVREDVVPPLRRQLLDQPAEFGSGRATGGSRRSRRPARRW
jgi:hypothetical protein